jgi:transposase
MERRQFTREFKLEAVRLIKQRGVSYAQTSKDLGVHPTQLRSWVKQLADDPQHAFPGHGQMKPEQLEIAQLKREVARLKAERDILKKAAALSVPKTLSELMTWWNRLSWWNDRTVPFRPGRPGLAIQVEGAA